MLSYPLAAVQLNRKPGASVIADVPGFYIFKAKINAYHVRFIIILYSNGYNFNNKTLFYIRYDVIIKSA